MTQTANIDRIQITQPILSNRFRVEIEDNPDLSRHISNIVINLAEKKIRLELRENIEGQVMTAIRGLKKYHVGLKVEFLSGGPSLYSTYTTDFACEIVDHEFRMDYSNAEMATHMLTLSFFR